MRKGVLRTLQTVIVFTLLYVFLVMVMANSFAAPLVCSTDAEVIDHQGADWILSDGDVISCKHVNISRFVVPVGVIVSVKPFDGTDFGWLEVHAINVTVQGTINATAAGYGGGGGGSGGGGQSTGGAATVPGANGLGHQLGFDANRIGLGNRIGGYGGAGAGPYAGQITSTIGQLGGYRLSQGTENPLSFDFTQPAIYMGSGGGGGRGGNGGNNDGGYEGRGGGGGGSGGTGGGSIYLNATESLSISGTILTQGVAGGNGKNGGSPNPGGNGFRGGIGGNGGNADVYQSGSGGSGNKGPNFPDGANGRAGGVGAGGGILLSAPFLSVTGTLSTLGGLSRTENAGTVKVFYCDSAPLHTANFAYGQMFQNSQYCGYCGDSIITYGEQCDDGNNINGDGCSSTCQIEVPPDYNLCYPLQKEIFTAGSFEQTVAPVLTNRMRVSLWGGGGASLNSGIGGVGGFTTATFDINPGTTHHVLVGEAGRGAGMSGAAFGGGGASFSTFQYGASGGGGLTGIFNSSNWELVSFGNPGHAVAIAGGGGGVSMDGTFPIMQYLHGIPGNSQSSPSWYTVNRYGSDAIYDNNKKTAGGGGGGYYGGISSINQLSSSISNGGSGFIATFATSGGIYSGETGSSIAPNSTHPEYAFNAGSSGVGGRAVIEYLECALCGNGIVEAGEQCDDGNNINGDGCSSTCRIEPTFCRDGSITLTGECLDSYICSMIENVTYSYTGNLQSVDVPQNANYVVANLWGAGSSAAGGFTKATIPLEDLDELHIVVGQSGFSTYGSTFGLGGSGFFEFVGTSYRPGGGLTGIFTDANWQNNYDAVLAIAGGGGGTFVNLQMCPCIFPSQSFSAGNTLLGSKMGTMEGRVASTTSNIGGGGGGGYFGGNFNSSTDSKGPVGGSGFVSSSGLYTFRNSPMYANQHQVPNSSLSIYVSPAAAAQTSGGHGLAVLQFLECQNTVNLCGNGELDGSEQCDDGNNNDGDGCSATCQIEPYISTQTIFRISSINSALAQTPIFQTYPITFEYDNLFGSPYLGDNPTMCNGTNLVVKLSQDTSALGAASDFSYPVDICYGDLVCTQKQGSCNIELGEVAIASMSSLYNAFFGLPGAYENTICCTAGPVVPVCGNGVVEVGEQCDFGAYNNQGFVSLTNSTFTQLTSLNQCSSRDVYACSDTCQLESEYEINPKSTTLTAHAFWDVDGNGLADDSWFFGSIGINGLPISLYAEDMVNGERTLIDTKLTESNWYLLQRADAKFTVDVYPDAKYYFVVDTLTSQYIDYAIKPTILGGDSVGVDFGTHVEFEIPLLSCTQTSSPARFGFVDLSYCGDGIVNSPNDYGFFEECDDGNNVDGDGCSAQCTIQEPPLDCGPNSQTILRMTGFTNAFVEHPSMSIYPLSLTYTDLFNTDFLGYNACACADDRSNLVVTLSSETNALASIDGFGYPVDICYGDLSCVARSGLEGGCINGEVEVISLTSQTNAFASWPSFPGLGNIYDTKICCTSSQVSLCGNGERDYGEQCDFGSFNDGTSLSRNSDIFMEYINPVVCQPDYAYRCNLSCQLEVVPILPEEIIDGTFTLTVFLDSNNNAQFSTNEGLSGITVNLVKDGVIVDTNISSSNAGMLGQVSFALEIDPTADYAFEIDLTQSGLNQKVLALNKTDLAYASSNASKVGNKAVVPIFIPLSCDVSGTYYAGFVSQNIQLCGNGEIDVAAGETCDFGSGRNNGATYSSTLGLFSDFTTPNVCQSDTAYVCSSTCQSSTVQVSTPAENVVITGRVFNDSNRDGNYAAGEGLSGVSVDLRKDGAIIATATSSQLVANRGIVTFTTSISPNATYTMTITNAQLAAGGYNVTLNKAQNPSVQSNLTWGSEYAFIPLNIDSSCTAGSTTYFMGLNKTGDAILCGNGAIDFGEQCDLGVHNGLWSTSGIVYNPWSSPTPGTCSPRYMCSVSACQLIVEENTLVTCPPALDRCDDAQFVACSINGTVEYGQGITYSPYELLRDDILNEYICAHDGSSWGFRYLNAGFDDFADSPEICSGGINSIDQNCNAFYRFQRTDDGSLDYTSYIDPKTGTVFSVKRDIDAFDSACFVFLSGVVSSTSGGSLVGANLELFIVSESGEAKSFRNTMSGVNGEYSFDLSGLPATRYKLVVSHNGHIDDISEFDLTSYKQIYTRDIVLTQGTCNSDCTTTANPDVCSAACLGVNSCTFSPNINTNSTIATFMNGKLKDSNYCYSPDQVTMTDCGAIVTNGCSDVFTQQPISGISCPSGTSLVVTELVVLYNGEPVKFLMSVCRVR
jgi:cysteine-rich repeat protein